MANGTWMSCSVWLEVEGGALYVDRLGVCADVLPHGNTVLESFLGARFVGAVDSGSPLGLGDRPLPGTLPLFAVRDAQGARSLLRAPRILAIVPAVSAMATGEHVAIDIDPDPTTRFSRVEDDRPTLKNLDDLR